MLKLPPPVWALVYVLIAAAISWPLDWPKMPGFPLPPLGIALVTVPWILPVWAIIMFRREGTEINPTSPTNSKLITIVFVAVPDPVGSKLVASLARPGANITGFSNMASNLTAKRVELLKEIVPGLSRAALLVNLSDAPGAEKYIEEGEIAARHLGLSLQPIGVRGANEIEGAFSKMSEDQLQGVVVTVDGLFYAQKERIAALALKHRLPTVVYSRETLEAGALMSYGPNQVTMFKRAAGYVDRILKGEKPADIPVDQPTTFELIVNLKTAKALSLTISPTLLARADEVIE